MGERKPLPQEIEDALDALQTSRNLAEGEAAKALVDAHFKPLVRLYWLLGLPFAGFAVAALIARDTPFEDPLRLASLVYGGVYFVALALPLRRRWNLDRADDAINRWRQIAGTLAVNGRPAP